MKVIIRPLGRLQTQVGQKKIDWTADPNITVKELLKDLEQRTSLQFAPDFVHADFSPRRSLIVLIDGAELSVYGDAELQLWDQVEIVLLPAIHGGKKDISSY
ncbi:MAG: MoaD/ThiS family protein [Candidatus Hodarchaeota archaeon]